MARPTLTHLRHAASAAFLTMSWVAASPAAELGEAAAYSAASPSPTIKTGESLVHATIDAVPQPLLLRYLADNSTFTLIDARSSPEYASAHIAGAINIPHDGQDLGNETLPVDLERNIVVYCSTGLRAAALQARLSEYGYKNVRILKPEQIVWFDGMAVFNCGAPSAQTLETRFDRTAPKRAKEGLL